VPWAFVYRDPLEIMVSNFRNAPVWLNHRADARMAAALSNVEEGEVRNISTEEFCARVLGRLFASASDNVTENARLLNHSELAVQTIVELAQFFGVSAADADRQRIEESLKVYSKDKTAPRLFAADSTEKRNAASAAMIVAVSRWAQGPYQQLEKRRTGEC
jgi:hypothetical protein